MSTTVPASPAFCNGDRSALLRFIRWVGRVECGGSVVASRCGDACGPEILVGGLSALQ